MLVGFPPFDGADSYSIGYKHVHETAAPPDVVDSRVASALAQVVMRCLAKIPAERYQRGDELTDALLGYLAGTASAAELRAGRLSRRLGITPTPR
jgi:serine/threonine-protein kinase